MAASSLFLSNDVVRKMSVQQERDDDDDLSSFFAEIDNLKITDDSYDDDDKGHSEDPKYVKEAAVLQSQEFQTNNNNNNNRRTSRWGPKLNDEKSDSTKSTTCSFVEVDDRQAELKDEKETSTNSRALETNKQKWKDFKNTKSDSRSKDSKTQRKPISISLTKKDVKKAKQKKLRNAVFQNYNDEPTSNPTVATVQSALPQEFRIPSWCLVLDTCSLLDNGSYGAMKDLYNIATAVASSSSQTTGGTIEGKEPIQIIVPYMVWNELDYRNKSSTLTDDDRYQARRAVRLLNEFASPFSTTGAAVKERGDRAGFFQVFASQTRSEMEQSAKELNQEVKLTNDDYILLCAVQQQNQRRESATSSKSGTKNTRTALLLILTLFY